MSCQERKILAERRISSQGKCERCGEKQAKTITSILRKALVSR